jgi:hypothetical protein
MATLVLSTVGSALGGPVGGAIGALIGQSIDQQLLGSATRGPRLNDLSVQTSSYGTQMPRIYGTMRVAGTVIWATDLVESTQTSGAKGQPDITYSYSVSMAVALSSRPVAAIKRIWADGNLLRGDNGDFKSSTNFRFYDGSEDQQIDPLIGSIEGIANTPAYRGLALAVFENLELADFGNRIPFLTFEIVADQEAPAIGAILADASAGIIASDAAQEVVGYAAYGQSIRSAIEPLIDNYAIDLFDDGSQLRIPGGGPQFVADDDVGNSADNQQVPRFQREQAPARTLPGSLRLSYYDPARDYQTGEARASASEVQGSEEKRELPAAVNAADAKSLVQQSLAIEWIRRDKLTLRLPPRYLDLEPGARLELSLTPSNWSVETCTIESFVAVAELRPSWNASPAMLADAGRITANLDVEAGPLSVALMDVPDVLQQSSSGPMLLLAGSTASVGWKRRSVEVSLPGQTIVAQTAARKSLLGRALTILPAAEPYLVDTMSSVDVELVDSDQWLTSCDDDALSAGTNLAVIGSELIQFADATPLGQGQFRLSRLLRGRGGTEWASASHAIDDVFCVVQAGAVESLPLPSWSVGVLVTASVQGNVAASVTITGESLRPPMPVNLTAAVQSTGDLVLNWTRRSRNGWAWVDGVDAPLGERVEQYRVTLTDSVTTAEFLSDQPSLSIPAAAVAALGTGPATFEVSQVGDFAASRPARISITLV